jgi:hypothetical protein
MPAVSPNVRRPGGRLSRRLDRHPLHVVALLVLLKLPLVLEIVALAEVVVPIDDDHTLVIAVAVVVKAAEMMVVAAVTAAATVTAATARLGCGDPDLRIGRGRRAHREGGAAGEDQTGHGNRHALRDSHGTCLLGEIEP